MRPPGTDLEPDAPWSRATSWALITPLGLCLAAGAATLVTHPRYGGDGLPILAFALLAWAAPRLPVLALSVLALLGVLWFPARTRCARRVRATAAAVRVLQLGYGAWFQATFDRHDPAADLARRTRRLVAIPSDARVDHTSVEATLRSALVGKTAAEVEAHLRGSGFGADELNEASADMAIIDHGTRTWGFEKSSYLIYFVYRGGRVVDVTVNEQVTGRRGAPRSVLDGAVH